MRLLSLSFLVALVSGCASLGPTAIGDRPALRLEDVTFYSSEADVPAEYEVIEIIAPPEDIARVGSGYDGTRAVERYALRRAAALGANGVVSLTMSEAQSNPQIRSAVVNGYTLSSETLVAISVSVSSDES